MVNYKDLKILVVEDDRISRDLAVHLIRELGCEPLEAASAEEAWLLRRGCQVVFMDLQLNGGPSGYDTALALISENPKCYIAAVTAHSKPDYQAYALACGIREFLAKPLTLEVVAQTLENAIIAQSNR